MNKRDNGALKWIPIRKRLNLFENEIFIFKLSTVNFSAIPILLNMQNFKDLIIFDE